MNRSKLFGKVKISLETEKLTFLADAEESLGEDSRPPAETLVLN
jgi:hypothetical protein